LTQEYYGQAKILPPLDLPPPPQPPPDPVPTAPVSAPPEPAPPEQPAAQPQTTPATPAPAPKAKAKPAPPALARGALALVNETGDPQVGAVYQSALSRLGYTILAGPAGGFGSGPAGQTVIYYRPGAQGRAQAVSRDLPGRKALAAAPAEATTDIVVVLR
jgi:outer membrane biosynthesis protein TonB